MSELHQARQLCMQYCLKCDEHDSVERLQEICHDAKFTDLLYVKGWKWVQINTIKKDNGDVFSPYIMMNREETMYMICDKGLICTFDPITRKKLYYYSNFYDKFVFPVDSVPYNHTQTLEDKANQHHTSSSSKKRSSDSYPNDEVISSKLMKIHDNSMIAASDMILPSAGRVLAIGNNIYTSQSALKNCVNDAKAIRNFFHAHGFHVDLHVHEPSTSSSSMVDDGDGYMMLSMDNVPNQDYLRLLVTSFADSIQQDDIVVFYYAGHGLQSLHGNVLTTIDCPLVPDYPSSSTQEFKYARDVLSQMMSLQEIHDILRKSCEHRHIKPKGIVFFLDACRGFSGGLTKSGLLKDTDKIISDTHDDGMKWNVVDCHGVDTIYHFSCEPGKYADDGPCGGIPEDRHSPYAKSLLRAFYDMKGQDVCKVLRRCNALTRDATMNDDGDFQRPWTHESILQETFVLL